MMPILYLWELSDLCTVLTKKGEWISIYLFITLRIQAEDPLSPK